MTIQPLDLAAHLAACDEHDKLCQQLDSLVAAILNDAPESFECDDERDDWICEQLDAADLNDWARDYVRAELRDNL